MKKRHVAFSTVGVLSLVMALLWPATAQGTVTVSTDDDTDFVSAPVSAGAQEAADDYWTEARLESALPGDELLAGLDLSKATRGSVSTGTPQLIPGTEGLGGLLEGLLPGLSSFGGGHYTGGGEVVQTTGKVFFTLNGTDYQCSGSAVNSSNRSLVLTAGHCLNDGAGNFASNFVFIPAFDDGDRPYGTFVARELLTTAEWNANEDLNYDVGFAVVNPVDGTSLIDTVGGQGIAFNQDRGLYTYAFGYPAASPYDGQTLTWCHGATRNDPLGSDSQGLRCNMTGGSSGGPWFIDYDEESGVGVLNSVNSFKYVLPILDANMYGPYFGAAAQDLYNTAESR